MFSNVCTFYDRNFSPSGTKLLLSLLLLFVNFLHVMDAVSLFDDNDVALVLFSQLPWKRLRFFLLYYCIRLPCLHRCLFFLYIFFYKVYCMYCFLIIVSF